MKVYFRITSLFIALIMLCSTAKKTVIKEPVLTTHKWTLVEIMQKENDTLTNLTMFLTPCEKDNFINYADNGIYKIHEGAQKCNTADNDIKGEGTWTFNANDSTILDSYQGGKKISKKVLMLNDEVLKIQYYGEARKLYTLTYFSEEGQKDEANKDLIIDNSDPSQNITQIIKNYLESTNRYIIVARKDFENGKRSTQDDKNGLKQTVAIMPFTNASNDGTNTSERTKQLMAHAKKADVDYVITGDLINAAAKLDEKNEYAGSVKYEVFILDAASGSTFTDVISDKDEIKKKEEKKKGGLLKTLAAVGSKVGTGLLNVAGSLYGGYYGYYYGNYYSTYNTLFKASRVVSAASTTASVFTDIDETVRSKAYKENNATLQAVSKTTENVIAFVADHTPTKIKISEIEGSGKKAQMIIEAGSNIGLEKGEVLSVVKITTKMVAGSSLQQKKELGEIEITEFIENRASYCSLEEGKDDIIKAFKETPNEIFAVPQLKQTAKK